MAYTLEIMDKFELMALYRALWEVQFNPRSSQREIAGSPLVAALIKRVSAMLEAEERGGGEKSPSPEWYREWDKALLRACDSEAWAELDDVSKPHCARAFLAPVRTTAPEVAQFVQRVDAHLTHLLDHPEQGARASGAGTRRLAGPWLRETIEAVRACHRG